MIAVVVTFSSPEGFEPEQLRGIADDGLERFRRPSRPPLEGLLRRRRHAASPQLLRVGRRG